MLAAAGVPASLKLTMMGQFKRTGGWRLRWEKQRRKLTKQIRTPASTMRIVEKDW